MESQVDTIVLLVMMVWMTCNDVMINTLAQSNIPDSTSPRVVMNCALLTTADHWSDMMNHNLTLSQHNRERREGIIWTLRGKCQMSQQQYYFSRHSTVEVSQYNSCSYCVILWWRCQNLKTSNQTIESIQSNFDQRPWQLQLSQSKSKSRVKFQNPIPKSKSRVQV